eukprot:TRINITY_DN13616_c3_g1_i1.p1 TRINITY_DN13616_c3_g1~~TRINITY_DN13616_c3_g1_i1.p1  ORF type:complete len:411 (-),score=66.41 TRINITY_DN13616_c3_g1_i1:631-1863(-)
MDSAAYQNVFPLANDAITKENRPFPRSSQSMRVAAMHQQSLTFLLHHRRYVSSSSRYVSSQTKIRSCQRIACPTCSLPFIICTLNSSWRRVDRPLSQFTALPSCFGQGHASSPRGKVQRRLVVRAAGPAGTGVRKVASTGKKPSSWAEWALIGIGVLYMTLMVFIPTANVFYQAFANGIGPFIANLLDPDFLHAVKMTLLIAGIVVPINTVFGLIMGIWLTRNDFPGKAALISFMDLPFSISPVVVGLMLMLLYGRQGLFAPLLRKFGLEVVFACPGMVLATAFVTLPFVVREVIPVLEEMDISEEEAARTMGANEWEVFKDVTLPNIQLGLLYGVTLCTARAMGEFGALSVISGNIIGRTQTLTLFVEAAYKDYNTQGAFSAALLLSVLAIITLFIKNKLEEMRARQMR